MHSLSNRVYNYNVSIYGTNLFLSSLPHDMTSLVASCQLYPGPTTALCMQPSSSLKPIASFPFKAATLLCSAAAGKPLDLPSVSSSFCSFNRLVGCPPLPSTDNITDTHPRDTASSDLAMMRTDAGLGFISTSKHNAATGLPIIACSIRIQRATTGPHGSRLAGSLGFYFNTLPM